PAFGVGVNYAIQDAVATANALVAARARGVRDLDSTLAAVQARRLPPVRAMQALQRAVHANIARPREHPLLSSPPTARQRVVLRLLVPLMQRVLPGLVGRGFRPEHLSPALRAAFRDAPS
ncbi:MAG: FAD-dependent oxidoreductase, partial [Herbiconiux sp.]|nr:FAD-dependent oxidoreductase [Herbiconiux sp.]